MRRMLQAEDATADATEAREQRATAERGAATSASRQTFKSNLKWATVGNAVYAACQWAMLVVLAKLGSAEAVGAFALGLALTAPVFMLAGLQLRGIQATDARSSFRFADYLAVRSAAMVVGLLVAAMLAVVTSEGVELRLTIVLVAFAKAIEGLSDVHYGLIHNHERLDVIAHSLIARGILALAGVAVGMSLTHSTAGAAAGMALSWMLVLGLHDIPRARALMQSEPVREDRVFEWDAIRRLVVLAAPLGFVIMLVSLQTNIPRYFVEHHLGRAQLGIFAALSSLVLAGNVFIGALGQAASPRLARQLASGDRSGFHRSTRSLAVAATAAGASGLLVAAVGSRPLLNLLFGAEYAAESASFIWMAVAGAVGFVASVLGYAMTAARQFRQQVPLFIGVLAVLAAACFLLVPPFGLRGVAWAWTVASAVQLVASAACVRVAGGLKE